MYGFQTKREDWPQICIAYLSVWRILFGVWHGTYLFLSWNEAKKSKKSKNREIHSTGMTSRDWRLKYSKKWGLSICKIFEEQKNWQDLHFNFFIWLIPCFTWWFGIPWINQCKFVIPCPVKQFGMLTPCTSAPAGIIHNMQTPWEREIQISENFCKWLYSHSRTTLVTSEAYVMNRYAPKPSCKGM